jgi:UDP-2,3-diacylglucosamine hydrolase
MHSIFISDLHLCPARPAINKIFFEFLKGPASQAAALYILGDLFEYWAGDDDDDPFNASVIAKLRAYAHHGIPLYLMYGNRDFLIGERFIAASGAILLSDPILTDLHGTPTLLMHGDTLCTDDVDYQRFRTQVRNPVFQQAFLARPLAARKQEIAKLRTQSEASKTTKAEVIMDVTPAAVEVALRTHGYPRLIHGHTHRPARHEHVIDGHRCERWVLADWYQRGSYLRCDAVGCESVDLN